MRRHRPDRRRRQDLGLAPDLRLRQRRRARRRAICAGKILRARQRSAGGRALALDGRTLVVARAAATRASRRPRRDCRPTRDGDRRSSASGTLRSADHAARRRRPGHALRDLRLRARRSPRSRSTSSSARSRCCTIIAAHDVGRAINPTLVEGQIQGGIAQGIGMALMEEYVPGRTENLHDYLIPTVGDVPPIEMHPDRGSRARSGPFGAKGVGEPALIADGAGDPQRDPPRDRRAHARRVPATPDRAAARRIAARRRGERSHERASPHAPTASRSSRALARARAMAADKVRCDACPVLCQISRGRAGACDRYGNVDGVLIARSTRCARRSSTRRQAGRSWSPFARRGATGTATLRRRRAGVRHRHRRRHHLSRLQAGALHRRRRSIEGVDMVTVVTEGIFSYCGVKVKIDTDRYLGPEQATVRVEGEAVGHVTTAEYGSQMLSLGGVHHLTGGSQEGRPRHLRDDAGARATGEPVELTIDGGATRGRAGRQAAGRRRHVEESACASAAARRRSACSRSNGTATSTRWSWSTTTSPACSPSTRPAGASTWRRPASACAAASRRRAATSRSPNPGLGWGGTDITDPLVDHREDATRSTARGPACAC